MIDITGDWKFALDPNDVGLEQQWYKNTLQDEILLPGSLQERGYGNDVGVDTKWTGQIVDNSWYTSPKYEKYRQPGNIKIPFWLQPDKHYVGAAWYQKKINIPAEWSDRYVELLMERTHWETTVFIDGEKVGSNNSLSTPHRYKIDKTGNVTLTVRVDNRLIVPVGTNAHSVSDHTQSNWNGIVGEIKLISRPNTNIGDVRVYPDVKSKKAVVAVEVNGDVAEGTSLIVSAEGGGKKISAEPVKIEAGKRGLSTANVVLDMGDDVLLWSEFTPNLYELNVELSTPDGRDVKTLNFGMREFKAKGTRFYVNDTPVFLRGTLECAIFPLTGYPAMDEAYWTKIYKRCKEFGLNHVRFHSWCPPEAAFNAADREGIYLQVECGVWTEIGNGAPIDKWIFDESERIIKEYGNHPSFCLMIHGNEPGGMDQVRYLTEFVEYWKKKDGKRRVYSGGAGWPYVETADYWNTPNPRIQQWGGGLRSIINSQSPSTDYDFAGIISSVNMPIVSHEIGQWCVYPNFGEMGKYTGVLKPKNYEIFKETLENNHLGDLAEKFLYASGRLQTLCYKADIEAALRTPGFAGFQLLDLHDFPGQGTALVGVLDCFWDTKGYVDGKEFSSFSNVTVPLARMDKMIFKNSEPFKAGLEVSHFAAEPLKGAKVRWRIVKRDGSILSKGETVSDLPIDNCIKVGDITCDLSKIEKPEQLTLEAEVVGHGQANKWNIWVYPDTEEGLTGDYLYTTNVDEAFREAEKGRNVLYCLPRENLKKEKGGDIKVGFSSIFWNTAWTRKQAPHTLGVLCDNTHPVFRSFPNDGYSDYQWWNIVVGSSAMVMDDFPSDYRPLVHFIDDWFTNRKLGLLFETKVGKGNMIVCSANLHADLKNRPAALQLRKSIAEYMASADFKPGHEINPELIKTLIE